MAAISGTTMAIAAAAAVGGAAVASSMSKKAGLPMDPLTSKLQKVQAETDVVQKTNSKLAQRNKALKASSLIADPLGAAGGPSVLGGKTQLGQ